MSVDDKIKVFDAEDNKLKILGELLSNDTSRKIIRMLIQQECYTNEISTKLNIRVSLVIHHLKKLEQIGVLDINHKQIVRKGNHHRYFRMVPGLFLMPNETKDDMEKKGFLKKFFREGIKFASIFGVASLVWFHFKRTTNSNHDSFDYGEILEIPFYQESIFLPMLIIICGLIINTIYLYKKNRKDH